MRTPLHDQDKVRYRTAHRRMRGTVVEFLPMPGLDAVPVRLRKRIVWLSRGEVRKLPGR